MRQDRLDHPLEAAEERPSVPCPECGELMRILPAQRGRPLLCPECGHEFTAQTGPKKAPASPKEARKQPLSPALKLAACSVLPGIVSLAACGIPVAGLLVAAGGLYLVGVALRRGGWQTRLGVAICLVALATNLVGLALGLASVRSWLIADTPAAIASHPWWETTRIRAQDIESFAAKIEALNAEDGFFVDRTGRTAVRSRLPESGFFQGRLMDAFRPPGIGVPYVCIYRAPTPSFKHWSHAEALHALRTQLDRGFSTIP